MISGQACGEGALENRSKVYEVVFQLGSTNMGVLKGRVSDE